MSPTSYITKDVDTWINWDYINTRIKVYEEILISEGYYKEDLNKMVIEEVQKNCKHTFFNGYCLNCYKNEEENINVANK